jgi:hypothetical protein
MNLSSKRSEIDIIYTEFIIKPSTDKSGDKHHSDYFCFCAQSFDSSFSSDIKNIVQQSQQPQTKKSKQQNIGLLPAYECIIDDAIVLQDIRHADHDSHHQQKKSASHGRSSGFMFVHLRKNS